MTPRPNDPFDRVSATTSSRRKKHNVHLLFVDTIKNIQSIVHDLDDGRDRGKAIYHDYLELIDIEVNIYGRESLIHLPNDIRAQVRKFMNEIAIKRVEVVSSLKSYYQQQTNANYARNEGDQTSANRSEAAANLFLQDAHKAVDRMVKTASDANSIMERLAKLK